MKGIVRKFFNTFGYEIMSKHTADRLKATENDFGSLMYDHHYRNGGSLQSKAQLKQDLFVLHETGFKRNGYFVEFGATNGVDLSNTWLLEKDYNWSGILAEPATVWHDDLRMNRSASIETDCVWQSTGEKLVFNMAPVGEFSTVERFSGSDMHATSRKNGQRIEVTTISLLDLLLKHNAPKNIDYLSIDTEGSELDIIRSFDFGKFDISIITIEHNFTSSRKEIYEILTSNGYKRKLTGYSKFDDWYVKA